MRGLHVLSMMYKDNYDQRCTRRTAIRTASVP